MQKLLLCLLALVAISSAVRNTKIQVKHEPDARVTDMDRLNYGRLSDLEDSEEEALNERVHPEDVTHFLESAIGPNWKDHVEVHDESEPISYLELIRLSTSVNFLNREMERREESSREARSPHHGFDGFQTTFSGGTAYANLCMCHGSFHATYSSATNGDPNAVSPYRGVRVLQKGGTYYGNNPYPLGLPQDCVLCNDGVDCRACCHGPCTIGNAAQYNAARAGGVDSDDTEFPMGLYRCPSDWQFSADTESLFINDISECTISIDTCGEAVGLCSCTERRHLIQARACECSEALVFCDSCNSAWDAIDKYKHCDCLDYADHYGGDGPTD